MKRFVLILILFLNPTLRGQVRDYKYIDALVAIPDLGSEIYYDDGAGDGSILRYGTRDSEYRLTNPLKEVQAIVALRERSTPLLIACLDDPRPTSITFLPSRWAKPSIPANTILHVPVGFVCLDILSESVGDDAKVFVPECSSDGMGACYQNGFYFRPEILISYGRQPGLKRMGTVKANWTKAYRKGLLHWRYPPIWRFEFGTSPS